MDNNLFYRKCPLIITGRNLYVAEADILHRQIFPVQDKQGIQGRHGSAKRHFPVQGPFYIAGIHKILKLDLGKGSNEIHRGVRCEFQGLIIDPARPRSFNL